MGRTRVIDGKWISMYEAPKRPTPIRPFVDGGHIPDVAGAETVPEPGGSLLRGIVVAVIIVAPLYGLVIYLIHRFTGLMPVS